MDEFGVLTERYGLKPQGKSAPMAAAKRPTAAARDFGFNSGLDPKPTSNSSKSSWDSNPVKGSFFDDHDVLFQSNSKQKHVDSFGVGGDYGDIFGGFQKPTKQSSSNNYSSGGSSFDFDSMFSNSGAKTSSTNLYADDDIFGGMPGVNSSKNASDGDIFASFTSAPRKTTKNDDLLGDLGGGAMNSKSSSRNGSWETKKNDAGFEDLIPGFGGSSPNNSTNTKGTKSTFTSTEDPFVVLEAASNQSYTSSEHSMDPLDEFTKFTSVSTKSGVSSKASSTLRPPPKPAVKVNSPNVSSIDELEDFAMGKARSKPTRHKEAEDATKKTQQNGSDDLESFFGMNSRSSSVPKSRATTLDPMFDTKIHNRGQKPSARMAPRPSVKKSPPASMPNVVDDLSAIFGDAPIFREFEEVDGESEERRRARLGRHQRTQDRVAKAVADMNHRDRQSQHEQEERSRIAESLDFKIKQWAMGKEGNLRALLSSMQNVLWPECGWEPVSLTDLITATSVKKVYRKATLSVHPDKVQQKGATVEQKYIAEKVFDILKEAWNKFNKEELS